MFTNAVSAETNLKRFFYEEVALLGLVISRHRNKEDLIFQMARVLDWLYRRHMGQIGTFENETVERLLEQSYKPHLSTVYLLEKHFPQIKETEHEQLPNLAMSQKQPDGCLV